MPSDEFKGICYDLEVKKPLAIAGFVQMLRYFLRRTLEDPRGSTSYGLRRVAPTWAAMGRLPESEKLALQNWQLAKPLLVTVLLSSGPPHS